MLSRITQWFNRKIEPKTLSSYVESEFLGSPGIDIEAVHTAMYSHRIYEELNDKFKPKTDTLIAPMYMNELLGVLLNDEQWAKVILIPNVHRMSIIRVGMGKTPEEIDIEI